MDEVFSPYLTTWVFPLEYFLWNISMGFSHPHVKLKLPSLSSLLLGSWLVVQ